MVVLHVVMGALVAWVSSGVAWTKTVAVAMSEQAHGASVFITVSGVNTRLCVRCQSSTYPTATYASTTPNSEQKHGTASTAITAAATAETKGWWLQRLGHALESTMMPRSRLKSLTL